ncbi:MULTISPECIES: hypothetical protein [unclassified Methylobacterium]|jgi:hypothetical protein|uniref:hypothetical protein n=1 Tax=unclassified Methylobacterium TaxID=2615210 RepID=UPI000701870D|nr:MULTISPECIES: hypothetical protein [unclassified Methylobacterium]KQO74900.1 hypothetical protein ASF18_16295 [Methylobacterium sp. Leaf89]KQO78377.1 hypothetical protein ASF20_12040 [Methylobacterium sp. Leaf88]KQT70479.1 hypothetical protein ASG51_13465 [Methylobacterium sp. Leaf465]
MRAPPVLAFSVLLVLGSVAAHADDKAACVEGIAMIKAELAKPAPEAAQPKLNKALRVAERELGEGEFDECLDAVGDARRALKP